MRRHASTDPEEHVQRILFLGLVLVKAGIVTGDYILEVMGLNDVAIVLNPDLRQLPVVVVSFKVVSHSSEGIRSNS